MNLLKLTIITTFLLTIFPLQTLAQTPDPNRDRLIQPPEEQIPIPVEDEPILPQPEQQPRENLPANEDTFTFPLQQIQILGSTIFTATDFAPITSPLEGQQASLFQLQGVADAITQLYFDAGYVNSRAILTRQAIEEGIVTIQVIEGSLADVQINGLQRTKPQYVLGRINEGVTTPLNIQDLEDKLRLLKTDPLFEDIKIELQPGIEAGETLLVLNITEAKSFYGSVFVDNYSSASVGSERTGITLGYRNLTGLGDNLRGSYIRSTTGGSDIFDFNYTIPVNPKNGTVQLRFVSDDNEVTQSPFDQLGIEGESQLYEVSFRQPLVRTSLEEFALSVGFAHRTGQTFLFNNIGTPFGVGAEADGTTRTS
ncbi:MAG: POTRA domain-containing protein, partial [Spirulinaceae cyanobacterium]